MHFLPMEGLHPLSSELTMVNGLGILSTLNIKTVLVTPQKWMKYWKDKFKIKLPKDKQERKRKLKELAAQYTDKKVTLYNSDAILIAVYGFMEQIKEEED